MWVRGTLYMASSGSPSPRHFLADIWSEWIFFCGSFVFHRDLPTLPYLFCSCCQIILILQNLNKQWLQVLVDSHRGCLTSSAVKLQRCADVCRSPLATLFYCIVASRSWGTFKTTGRGRWATGIGWSRSTQSVALSSLHAASALVAVSSVFP